MNPDIMTVADDLTTDALAQSLVEREISGAPVVDSQGHLTGVREVTKPAIHQVPVTASVAEAAWLMVHQHIHRLVVAQGKEPVGINTSLDLLKIVAEYANPLEDVRASRARRQPAAFAPEHHARPTTAPARLPGPRY